MTTITDFNRGNFNGDFPFANPLVGSFGDLFSSSLLERLR
jgi:hypothetical protein